MIICDSRIPKVYKQKLSELFPEKEIVFFEDGKGVYPSILHHPDIYFFQIDVDTIIYSPGVSENLLNTLKKKTELIMGDELPIEQYPFTAKYNACKVGKYVLHNKNITDKAILRECEKRNLTFIHVEQGYTRCSIVPVGDNSIITSDNGIATAAKEYGIDVLTVEKGYIDLPGEEYGFIGGTSGVINNKELFFMGDIEKHPDSHEILSFLENREIQIIFPPIMPLFDSGSVLFLNNIM